MAGGAAATRAGSARLLPLPPPPPEPAAALLSVPTDTPMPRSLLGSMLTSRSILVTSRAISALSLVAEGSVMEREMWSHIPWPIDPFRGPVDSAPSMARHSLSVRCLPRYPCAASLEPTSSPSCRPNDSASSAVAKRTPQLDCAPIDLRVGRASHCRLSVASAYPRSVALTLGPRASRMRPASAARNSPHVLTPIASSFCAM